MGTKHGNEQVRIVEGEIYSLTIRPLRCRLSTTTFPLDIRQNWVIDTRSFYE